MISIDFSSREPIHAQVYGSVVKFIAKGILKPGEQLPPVRGLANDLGLNPNTVAKAYQNLERDGYINSVVGRGSFVSENLSALTENKKLLLGTLKKSIEEALKQGITEQEILELLKGVK